MKTEPSRLIASITAAVTATIGVVTLVGWWSPEVAGGITVAAGAWIYVAGEIVRTRVTPVIPTERGILPVDGEPAE